MKKLILIKGQSCPTLYVPGFEIPLLPHQAFAADWIEGSSKSLIIQAPTASGKTLAALSALLRLSFINTKASATFVYPTNELIKNQVSSMVKSLSELKYRPAVFSTRPTYKGNNYNVAIIEGTGEVLHSLAFSSSKGVTRSSKIRSFGSVLASLLAHTSKINILATNPDSLYLATSAKYGSSPSILTEIADADLFVIDEFHAYHGVSLANLMYTLKMIDCIGREKKRFIFLSATPANNLFDIIQNMFGDIVFIRLSDLFSKGQRKARGLVYKESFAPRIISHDIKLSLQPISSLEDLNYLCDLISGEVNRIKARKKDIHTIPCVLILNSVLDAVSISKVLQNRGLQVSQIHGLIPKSLREISGDVIVGTSAIELGIDFQAHSVIFEGTDSASFLQRFGRAGRHFEGTAIGFVPARITTNSIGNSLERETFEAYISTKLTNNENYAGFMQSSYGMDLLSAMLLSVYQSLDEIKEKRTKIDEAKSAILRIGYLVQRSIGAADVNLQSNMYRRIVKSIASKPSARGSSYSVIVFLRPYNAAINIDVAHAYRKLEGLEEIDSKSVYELINNNSVDDETKALLTYALHSGFPVMESTGIAEVKKQVELAIRDQDSRGVMVAGIKNPITLIINGQPLIGSQSMFSDIPYSVSPFYPDWRLSPIPVYESDNNFGIIGINALVYKWSINRK